MNQSTLSCRHSFCHLTGPSNSHSLSPEGQDPNPERTSVSCPALPPLHMLSAHNIPEGSGLYPLSTHRCLSVQEEVLVVQWLRQHLGWCLQNLGGSCSLACLVQACGFQLA